MIIFNDIRTKIQQQGFSPGQTFIDYDEDTGLSSIKCLENDIDMNNKIKAIFISFFFSFRDFKHLIVKCYRVSTLSKSLVDLQD